jgi:glycosyltransferase involved in cell wall biosynthesis
VRLLLVSNGYPPRGGFGTEFYTRELARALARRGHEVAVLHPERGGGKPRYTLERVEVDGLGVHLLHNPGDPHKRFGPSYRDPEVERVFADFVARERPEVVHFTYLLWGLSLRLPEVARARGIPSLATLTDYGLLCHRGQMFDARLARCGGPHPPATCARCVRRPSRAEHGRVARFARALAAEVLARAGGFERVPVAADLAAREAEVRRAFGVLTYLIAPTRALLEVFARAGAPREKLVPLVYAFDESAYRPRPPTSGPALLGFLGQLAPHKGLAWLVEASRELARLVPALAWELRLHGRPEGRFGPWARSVLERADPAHVRLIAPFAPDEAPAVMAGLAALVVPSEWDENAPLSVLQARALGVPVVASDVPGIAELVRPSQGRLVPVGDVGALARALAEVVTGGLRGPLEPGPALALEQHVLRLEDLYRQARAPTLAVGHG